MNKYEQIQINISSTFIVQVQLQDVVMAVFQAFQISFESEVCGVKWRQFNNKIVNKYNIVTGMELIFGQLITHDKMKLV